jgi:quercetin dioxygenase-like cupin family protein
MEGEPEIILRPGDVFFEPAGVPIARIGAIDEDVTFRAYLPLM